MKITDQTKFLISPTHAIGKYWARQMDLENYCIVTGYKQIAGLILKWSQLYFIDGDLFDCPEYTLSRKQRQRFDDLIELVELKKQTAINDL